MNSAPASTGASAKSRTVRTRPPTRSPASSTMTRTPAPASARAAVTPAIPAPSTTTSAPAPDLHIPRFCRRHPHHPAKPSKTGTRVGGGPGSAGARVSGSQGQREPGSVRARFVSGVGGGLELEGGVLGVEVAGQAGLELVEQPGGVTIVEA